MPGLAIGDIKSKSKLEKLCIGALKKKKEEKDNQYKVKEVMAIAIGLNIFHFVCGNTYQ